MDNQHPAEADLNPNAGPGPSMDAPPTSAVIPDELPLLPSGEAVVFPGVVVPLVTRAADTIRLIEEAYQRDHLVAIFAERVWTEHPDPRNFYETGTAAIILRLFRLPDGGIQALLQGLTRVRLLGVSQVVPYARGGIEVLHEEPAEGAEAQALARSMIEMFQKLVESGAQGPRELENVVTTIDEYGNLADFMVANLANLKVQERQEVLERLDVASRMHYAAGILARELEVAEVGAKIQNQVKDELDKRQKEFYLREQIKAIRKELGEGDDDNPDIREFRTKIEAMTLPAEARREAEREIERLGKMSPASAEYIVARTFLEWVTSLPWIALTPDNLDIRHAAAVLDEDHYGLEKVKGRILDYLAVRRLKPDSKGPILCFVGPPGVGKTSMGASIARALGRKFVRMSLGGVRDEAEVRGHRRTYVGAMPGRVIQGLRRAETRNPVVLLDEIDKLGSDFRGDPSSALLEVLDPQQNGTFVDHYLDVPFDLSGVMFITTANLLDTVPPALRDRMEVIELPGYTEREKMEIARRYLTPRQVTENGLSPDLITITDAALLSLIQDYTREAGVRNLEREIGTVCRKVARKVAEAMPAPAPPAEETGSKKQKAGSRGISRLPLPSAPTPTVVDAAGLKEYLGRRRFQMDQAERSDEIGVAAGLAVTPVGGEVLFVEASLMQGKGGLTLTGSLGDVMQESAKAALTYLRTRASELGLPAGFADKQDIHIHVPAGATPKDGPSAGVTLAAALLSAVSRRPVARDVAMTGEITLRGKVLPVGGVKEKVLAAHRAGMKRVIVPRENEKDLEEIPEDVRAELDIVLAAHLDEVVPVALRDELSARRRASSARPVLAA